MNYKVINKNTPYQCASLCVKNKLTFVGSGESTYMLRPASAIRQDNHRAGPRRWYNSAIKRSPTAIITAPIVESLIILWARASDIQWNILGKISSEENQKKALPTSAKIPAATKPNIHFSADISALIAINRASVSFRKSLISWRKFVSSFSKSFLITDSYSRKSALVARSAVSCELLTATEIAFAWASGIPDSLSVSTNCNVSNVTTAIANTSCLQILAQDFLCDVYTRKAANEGEYDPWSLA
ncbi:hypothetical protein EBME_0030 [bacterium endosymbiont of Mortierella elongata FMR23-6]|nr:hypothetical protein EBME_0030 [bacterium endosymbiont of Mortierella elongata FMR23-6]